MLYRAALLPGTLELLKNIMAKPALAGFYLAGGTSLALQTGQRKSVDLDFFAKRQFETQEILDELQDLAPIYVMSQSRNPVSIWWRSMCQNTGIYSQGLTK